MLHSPDPRSAIKSSIASNASKSLRLSCAALLLYAAVLGASATRADEPQGSNAAVRLVTAREGHAIAAAALAQEEPPQGAQDCSHLVHYIYSAAGYEYPYASSFDLYAGNGNFRRVRHAQSGDLVTWPGHVGIVIDPSRHSFHSLVRSGLQTEDYFGRYWRSRGRPRFYRYVIDSGSDVETAKLTRPMRPSGKNSSQRNKPDDAEVYAEADKQTPNETPEAASMRLKMPAPPRAPGLDAAIDPAPRSILLTSEQRRPTSEEALGGIAELSRGAASSLRAAESLRPGTTVVIMDEFRIERVETKRNSGWVHLQIDSHVRIGEEGVDFKRRHEKLRWELRHDAAGWQAIAPANKAYVSRDDAVRVLAAQLAEMADSDEAARHDEAVLGEEARLANLLSALLQK